MLSDGQEHLLLCVALRPFNGGSHQSFDGAGLVVACGHVKGVLVHVLEVFSVRVSPRDVHKGPLNHETNHAVRGLVANGQEKRTPVSVERARPKV